jgi:MFS family permease
MLVGAGLIGSVGVAAYHGIRVRHERRQLRAERADRGRDRPGLSPLSLWRTLRADPAYARFMLAMFIFGTGNLMVPAPLVIVLRDQFGLGSLWSVAILSAVPYLVMPWAIPFWARLISARHVAGFRARHSWAFVASQTAVFVGAAAHSLPILFIAAALQGIAGAGGAIAWNLGHLDYAPPHRATEYMGVHVTLNGLRGLLGPLAAVKTYTWIDARWPGQGFWVFGVSVVLCVTGAWMFVSLSHRMGEGAVRPVRGGRAGTVAEGGHAAEVGRAHDAG